VCGDLGSDEKLSKVFTEYGTELDSNIVSWYWADANNENEYKVGFKRTSEITRNVVDDLIIVLQDHNISLIDPVVFEKKLPSIKNIFIPSSSFFNCVPPNWGFWDEFTISFDDDFQWNEIDHWQVSNCEILKWAPSKDRRGIYGTRYFLHKGFDQLAELSQSYARLWMFYLLNRKDIMRRIWVDDNMIWTPVELPDPHQHWLQLISEDWYREKHLRKYILKSDPEPIVSRLNYTLGLHLIPHQP
jgi:hypothetical protein